MGIIMILPQLHVVDDIPVNLSGSLTLMSPIRHAWHTENALQEANDLALGCLRRSKYVYHVARPHVMYSWYRIS